MQILIRILAKNKYVFYFFFLAFISLISIFNNNPYYSSSYFNSSNYIIGKIFQTRSSIVSYFITEEEISDSLYYPYPTSIYLYDNSYYRDKQFPSFSFKQPIGFLLAYNFWRNVPDIIYDGILDPAKKDSNGLLKESDRICVVNNINASIANIDAENDFSNISTNFEEFNCIHESISPVIIDD